MKTLTYLLIFFFSVTAFSQNEEKISWSEDYRLTWSDFKAPPRSGVSYVASTTSGISFSYSVTEQNGNRDLKVTVTSYFFPRKSWVDPDHATAYILGHEQAHFDISELHARMLRKEISEASFSKNLKKEIKNLYQSVEERRVAMQHQFDSESNHSKNKEGEYKWEAYIKEQLENYEPWK